LVKGNSSGISQAIQCEWFNFLIFEITPKYTSFVFDADLAH
jgi:hypothetical protein